MFPTLQQKDLQLCLPNARSASHLSRIWRVNNTRIRRRILRRRELNQVRFFCQNSGGCGSTYLIKLLNDNGVAGCFHELQPDLNQIGVDHYDQALPVHRLKPLLRFTRWDVFFEANNRLFSLSQELAQAFPAARFMHLFRDGRQAVASAMSKPELSHYLANNIRFQGSLAGSPEDPPLTRFCHYWNNINRRILDDFEQLPDRCSSPFYLSLDQLKRGEVGGLEQFIGVDLPLKSRPVVNRGRVGRQGAYPPFDAWSRNDQQTFWDICGLTQERLQQKLTAVRS